MANSIKILDLATKAIDGQDFALVAKPDGTHYKISIAALLDLAGTIPGVNIDDYVKKETGKVLSSNDFTNELKDKLTNFTGLQFAESSDFDSNSDETVISPARFISELEERLMYNNSVAI